MQVFTTQKEAIQASFQEAKIFCTSTNRNSTEKVDSMNVTDSKPAENKKHHFHLFSFFKKTKKEKEKKEVKENHQSIQSNDPYHLDEAILSYELKLDYAADDSEARNVVCSLVAAKEWNFNGQNLFYNKFFTSLRENSIEAYRKVVEDLYVKVYNGRLDKSEITAYRGDTRHHRTIFKEGFKRWPRMNNLIFLSTDTNIARGYGKGSFYEVHLPKSHQLFLSSHYGNIFTSSDDIPPQYIKSFHKGHLMGDKIIKNPNYKEDEIIFPSYRP